MSVDFHPQGVWDDDLCLNVANGNASTIIAILGDEAPTGSLVYPSRLGLAEASVRAVDPSDYVRATISAGNVTFFGVTREQADGYRTRLLRIVEYCRRHRLALVWS